MSNFIVRKVAVLGAGVMGAQIAAHLVNAGVPAVLFDLPAKEGPKSGIAQKAIEQLKKQNPAPLGHPDLARLVRQVVAIELQDIDLRPLKRAHRSQLGVIAIDKQHIVFL